MNKKKIIGLAVFSIGSMLLTAFMFFFYYYSMKAGLGGLELVIPLLLFISLLIALFVISLIYFILKSKREHSFSFMSFIPMGILLFFVLVPVVSCAIDYAVCDKALYGIPKEYQEKLSYSTFMEEEFQDISYDDGDTVTLTEDENDRIKNYLKNMEVSKPVPMGSNMYSDEMITIYYGNDDFYGLKIYTTGYMSATYMGDILGPYYEMYYTYDATLFAGLKALITEINAKNAE